MERATLMAEAFVSAAAKSINKCGYKQAPWPARRVAERVEHTKTGMVVEQDIFVNVCHKTSKQIVKQCQVRM